MTSSTIFLALLVVANMADQVAARSAWRSRDDGYPWDGAYKWAGAYKRAGAFKRAEAFKRDDAFKRGEVSHLDQDRASLPEPLSVEAVVNELAKAKVEEMLMLSHLGQDKTSLPEAHSVGAAVNELELEIAKVEKMLKLLPGQ